MVGATHRGPAATFICMSLSLLIIAPLMVTSICILTARAILRLVGGKEEPISVADSNRPNAVSQAASRVRSAGKATATGKFACVDQIRAAHWRHKIPSSNRLGRVLHACICLDV